MLIPTGPCALAVERLAGTFAKWALGVRGLHNIGYHVPAPRSFKRFARTVTGDFHFSL